MGTVEFLFYQSKNRVEPANDDDQFHHNVIKGMSLKDVVFFMLNDLLKFIGSNVHFIHIDEHVTQEHKDCWAAI